MPPETRALAVLVSLQACYSVWFLALRRADLRLDNKIYHYLQERSLSLDLLGFSKTFQTKKAKGKETSPLAASNHAVSHQRMYQLFKAASVLAWTVMALLPLYLAGVLRTGLRGGSPAEQASFSIELPRSHIGLMATCFLISAAVHEMFHALAMWACGEPVGEFGFGIRLLVPTFFVRSRRPLCEVPLEKKRAILAAGPVGNFCLAGILLLTMWLIYFLVIGGLCQKGAGITVLSFPGSDGVSQNGTQLRYNSNASVAGDIQALRLPSIIGVLPGDVIEAVGDCPVTGLEDYYMCLTDLSRSALFGEPIVYDFDHSVTHKLSLLGGMAQIDHGEPKRLGHGGIRIDMDSSGYNLIYPDLDREAEASAPLLSNRHGRELAPPQQLLASEPYIPGQQQFIRILQPIKLKRESRALAGSVLNGRYSSFDEVSRNFCFRTSENDEDGGSCILPHSPSLPGYLWALTRQVPEGDEANIPFPDETLDPDALRFYLALRINGEYRIVEASLRSLWDLVATPYVARNRENGVLTRVASLGLDLPGMIDLFFRSFVQASLAMGVFALLPFPPSSDGAQLLQTLEAPGGENQRSGQRAEAGHAGGANGPTPLRVMTLYTYTGVVLVLFISAVLVSVF